MIKCSYCKFHLGRHSFFPSVRVCVCVSSKVASEKFDMIYKIFLGPMKTVGQVTAKQSSLKERRDDDDDGDEREEEEKKKRQVRHKRPSWLVPLHRASVVFSDSWRANGNSLLKGGDENQLSLPLHSSTSGQVQSVQGHAVQTTEEPASRSS